MDDKLDLLAVLEVEFDRHPRLDAEDLRKLIVQSVFGGDHLLDDPERFRDDLIHEWRAVHRQEKGLAIQPISPDGRTARIHLAACKAAGIDVGELAGMLLAQPRRRGTKEGFVARWRLAVELAAEGRIPICSKLLEALALDDRLPHHSKGYGPAAYRVINDLCEPGTAAWLRTRGLEST